MNSMNNGTITDKTGKQIAKAIRIMAGSGEDFDIEPGESTPVVPIDSQILICHYTETYPGDGEDPYEGQYKPTSSSEEEGEDEAGGCHFRCIVMPSGTELTRDIVARAMTEEESESLHKEHQRENHTDSRRCLGVDTPYEERICQVVQTRDKHADDRWHSHGRDDPMDGSRREIGEIIVMVKHNLS